MNFSISWLLLFLSSISVEVIAAAIVPKNMFTATITTPKNCRRTCGNLTIPYPFGIRPECALDDWFSIKCDKKHSPPKAFLERTPELKDREILDITESEVVIRNKITSKCHEPRVTMKHEAESYGDLKLAGSPFTISHAANKLTVIGCNDYALIKVTKETGSQKPSSLHYRAGCIAVCENLAEVIPGSCSGLGCCQTAVPIGLQDYTIALFRLENPRLITNSELQPCSYAFFAKNGSYRFGGASDLALNDKIVQQVPVVLDWAFQRNTSCKEAQKTNSPNIPYICQSNTQCIDSNEGGYRCSCLPGYEGNPYLKPGCIDIDECTAGLNSPCSMDCTNTPGSYNCSCPSGYAGDGYKSGTKCVMIIDKPNPPPSMMDPDNTIIKNIALGFGISLGTILLLVAGGCLYSISKRRKAVQRKVKNLERNGGLLLEQQMSCDSVAEGMKFFTSDELEKATDHFNKDRIVGEGGHGTVYKGMLSEGRLVAVKKSNIMNESELKQFINEMVILSQINHRNIVRLLGCCLETEVPLIVFEFISNGTLFDHIHNPSEEFYVTWMMRLQIAYDSAGALDYLHTSSSIPIFHKDIKSSNILLDDKYRAKLSDFGTSSLVAIGQTHITTLVTGTFGYLDPGYFQSSQFSQKSDVYSFGVVLVELLTRQKAIRTTEEDKSLIYWFQNQMEDSRLLDIIDPQILPEGSKEEFLTIANLAIQCLNLDGKKRPTMKEVQQEIERVKLLHSTQTNEQKWPESQHIHGVSCSNTISAEESSSSSATSSLLFSPR